MHAEKSCLTLVQGGKIFWKGDMTLRSSTKKHFKSETDRLPAIDVNSSSISSM